MHAKGRSVFTLVELLMVIAIIMVMAGLLIPVLLKARTKAFRVQCVSNLKQLGIGVIGYEDDNGVFPDWYGWNGGAANTQAWAFTRWYPRIFPYVTDYRPFQDPALNTWNAHWVPPREWPNDNAHRVNYALGRCAAYDHSKSYSMARYRYPLRSILVTDCALVDDCGNRGHVAWANVLEADTHYELRTEANARHNGGSNICFMDGHAEWQSALAIYTGWNVTIKPGP